MYFSRLYPCPCRYAFVCAPWETSLVWLEGYRSVQYGLDHISVGDLLREQVADGTPIGLKAKEFMDSGNLVPDEVVVDMVVATLDKCEKTGWLLDGYPRSASQAQALEKRGIRPDVVLLITVPDEVIVDRVVGRRLDPETGNIYHMTFKPPPADIVDRLKQVRCASGASVDAASLLDVMHLCSACVLKVLK